MPFGPVSDDYDPKTALLAFSPDLLIFPRDVSTLFQDDAHTTPITEDGQTVGAILDLGAEGDYWAQATAAEEPTYNTAAGLHWLENDGGDSVAKTFVLDDDDFYVAMAIRPLAGSLGFTRYLSMYSVGGGVADNAVGGFAFVTQASGEDALIVCGGGESSFALATDADAVVEFLFSGAGVTAAVDGVDVGAIVAAPSFAVDDISTIGRSLASTPAVHRHHGFFARRGTVPAASEREAILTAMAFLQGRVEIIPRTFVDEAPTAGTGNRGRQHARPYWWHSYFAQWLDELEEEERKLREKRAKARAEEAAKREAAALVRVGQQRQLMQMQAEYERLQREANAVDISRAVKGVRDAGEAERTALQERAGVALQRVEARKQQAQAELEAEELRKLRQIARSPHRRFEQRFEAALKAARRQGWRAKLN